jgi:recombination associated protein RdgC
MSIQQFRNATVYQIVNDDCGLTPMNLGKCLVPKAARQIASQEFSTMGFVSPFGGENSLVGLVNLDTYLISVLKQERLLPGKAVKQAVEAKVAKIEEAEQRRLWAKEKSQIKEEVVMAMLPHAFVVHSRLNALIQYPYIFIDTNSAKKAEDVLCLLREALGSLPVRPLAVKVDPVVSFTHWVANGVSPSNTLSVGEAFKSSVPSEKPETLSGKNVCLSDEDIVDLFANGRQVTELELSFNLRDDWAIPFNLTADLVFKGIQWPVEMGDKLSDDLGEDANTLTEARATYLLLSTELRAMVAEVVEALGGELVATGLSEADWIEDPVDEDELV